MRRYKTEVNLDGKAIRNLRESNMTIGEFRRQVGYDEKKFLPKKTINTKKSIKKLVK